MFSVSYNVGYHIAILLMFVTDILAGVNLTIGSCVIQYFDVCESEFVKFYISSSDHPEQEPYLIRGTQKILPTWISPSNQYKLVVHGYGGGLEYQHTKSIHLEYLKYNSTNVITIDWGTLAALPCYPSAAVNTKQAGDCIATFLIRLASYNPDFDPSRIHIIGFSLGAHVAAFASNSLEKLTGKKIQRITGLDPALPFFATSLIQQKLDPTDAEFVDVIHTNVGIYGKIESCGHVDFYINGGQLQPSCNSSKNIPLCSHTMSTVYFKESIKSVVGFWGVRCSSYFQYIFGWCGNSSSIINTDIALMGEHCLNTTRGVIFVYTRSKSPYAMGKDVLLSKKKAEML